MSSEKKEVERTLELNLKLTDDWILVTSHDLESGDRYTLDFENESKSPGGWTRRQPRDIMLRIGMEVWSWIEVMMDQKNADESRD